MLKKQICGLFIEFDLKTSGMLWEQTKLSKTFHLFLEYPKIFKIYQNNLKKLAFENIPKLLENSKKLAKILPKYLQSISSSDIENILFIVFKYKISLESFFFYLNFFSTLLLTIFKNETYIIN